jgi:hypothetical protein
LHGIAQSHDGTGRQSLGGEGSPFQQCPIGRPHIIIIIIIIMLRRRLLSSSAF